MNTSMCRVVNSDIFRGYGFTGHRGYALDSSICPSSPNEAIRSPAVYECARPIIFSDMRLFIPMDYGWH